MKHNGVGFLDFCRSKARQCPTPKPRSPTLLLSAPPRARRLTRAGVRGGAAGASRRRPSASPTSTSSDPLPLNLPYTAALFAGHKQPGQGGGGALE
eukprot:192394-Rhodomonas_salina.1